MPAGGSLPPISKAGGDRFGQQKSLDMIISDNSHVSTDSQSVAQYLAQVENKYPTALGGMFGVPEEGVLTVVKADGLKQSDMYDGADPYCKLIVNGVVAGSTSVQEDTYTPLWNEKFDLTLLTGQVNEVRLEVYDHDDAAYDEDPDFLGQVVLSAKGTTSLPTHETTFPLTRKKERDGMLHLKDRTIPDPYNEAVGGSLTFKYTPAERDIKKRLRAALKPAVNHNAVRRGAAASKQSCALDLSFAGLASLEDIDEDGATDGLLAKPRPTVGNVAHSRGFKPWKISTISDDSLPDMDAARKLFAELDLDGNGTLDITEIGQLLRVLKMPRSASKAKECMGAMDEDSDGEVEFEEFYGWWRKTLLKQQQKRWHAEATIDSVKLCNNKLFSVRGLYESISCFFPLYNPALTLQWLDLSHNQLEVIDEEVFKALPNITILSLHANKFHSFDEIKKLGCCQRLRKLSLHGCPLGEARGYRRRCLHALAPLAKLHHLDFAPITQLERADWHSAVAKTTRNRIRAEKSTPSVFLRAKAHLNQMQASVSEIPLPKVAASRSESAPPKKGRRRRSKKSSRAKSRH